MIGSCVVGNSAIGTEFRTGGKLKAAVLTILCSVADLYAAVNADLGEIVNFLTAIFAIHNIFFLSKKLFFDFFGKLDSKLLKRL